MLTDNSAVKKREIQQKSRTETKTKSFKQWWYRVAGYSAERNDKYLPSANYICLKEEKLNRSVTVVAHVLFCHQAKDYLYCIVYKFRYWAKRCTVAFFLVHWRVFHILLARLLARGPKIETYSHLIYPSSPLITDPWSI